MAEKNLYHYTSLDAFLGIVEDDEEDDEGRRTMRDIHDR